MRAALALVIVLALAGLAHAGSLRDGSAAIEAGSLDYSAGVYSLAGGVSIAMPGLSVSAERALYDETAGTLVAEGSIHMVEGRMEVWAERADLNLRTRMGELHGVKVYVPEGGYRLNAGRLTITGPETFALTNATATTCAGTPPAWCVTGEEFDVQLGEQMTASNATFRIMDVPVLYIPYLWAPIITERRSGLLIPKVGYQGSRGGFIREPFFWAIAENRDATLTLDYYSRWGFGQSAEYRYIESPRASGEFRVHHMGLFEDAPALEGGRDYYEAEGSHQGHGELLTLAAGGRWTRDEDFYRTEDAMVEGRAERFLEATAEVFIRPTEQSNSRIYTWAGNVQDIKNSVSPAEVPSVASVGVFVAPIALGPLTFAASADATEFMRDAGYEGTRASGGATATATSMLGPLALDQEATASARHYSMVNAPSALEESADTSEWAYVARATLPLERAYGSYTHTIEPGLAYYHRATSGEPPVELDRAEAGHADRSEVALVIASRVHGPAGRYMTMRVEQPMDLASGENKARPLRAELSAGTPGADSETLGWGIAGTAEYDHYMGKPLRGDVRAGLQRGEAMVMAGASYEMDENIETYLAEAALPVGEPLLLGGSMRMDARAPDKLEEARASVTWRAQCWQATVGYVKRPGDYQVLVEFRLAGL
jgi:LPS-assembly protein